MFIILDTRVFKIILLFGSSISLLIKTVNIQVKSEVKKIIRRNGCSKMQRSCCSFRYEYCRDKPKFALPFPTLPLPLFKPFCGRQANVRSTNVLAVTHTTTTAGTRVFVTMSVCVYPRSRFISLL